MHLQSSLKLVVTTLLAMLGLELTALSAMAQEDFGSSTGTSGFLQSAWQRAFPEVELTTLPDDMAQPEFIDAAGQIPNYVKSNRWGELGEPLSRMQAPLSPAESRQRIVTPKGFRVELFAAEPDLQGKPICIAWDERGRLWVAETLDYPNELQEPGKGRDRIRICEDTNGDGRADKFTVFAENLSIPTSMAFSRGGVIVQDGTQTVFLKDSDGDDLADEKEVLIHGWQMGDTHGGVSNFQYGLDNWIWAMQGYNSSNPVALGKPQQSFRMGFFRMKPDGSQVEFIRSTNNNTWGLGISEEGLVFGSTANGNPSIFMPIPNRYYERVRGWAPSLTLSSIADSNRFLPITDKVRQVDHFGGYTAAAGHALYTARQYPEEYWNRVAFVCEPTGHLVASFVVTQHGSGFRSTNPFNLFASIDEWTAPIMAEVGPDGNVWVVDWYNYIVQHNPTPKGFQTGKGNAYESELRDKRHGRIYRVVFETADPVSVPDLRAASDVELVDALRSSVMITRKHAQRLIVERANRDVVPKLVALVADTSVDSLGLNAAAIHSLWALHGLGVINDGYPEVLQAVLIALKHPSAGVRRNAVQVLPASGNSVVSVLDANLHRDQDLHTRLAAILAFADLPGETEVSRALLEVLQDPNNLDDPWLMDATKSAAASVGAQFLKTASELKDSHDSVGEVYAIVAEHFARGDQFDSMQEILGSLQKAPPTLRGWVLRGLSNGWQKGRMLPKDRQLEANLESLLQVLDTADQALLVRLAERWGLQNFSEHVDRLVQTLVRTVQSPDASDDDRLIASKLAVEFQPENQTVIDSLLETLSPRLSPELAQGICTALEAATSKSLPNSVIRVLPQMPPVAKNSLVRLLLKRPEYSLALLDAVAQRLIPLSDVSLDQRQALGRHPDPEVRSRMNDILAQGGALPHPDRQRVLDELTLAAHRQGNPIRGKQLFQQHCSKCHTHEGVGTAIGPDLTGMSVHPKEEMLTHILDPNRSVESNFRAYSVLTVDGVVLTGMLAAESRTAIEIFDTEGKRQSILREDIEQITASVQSIMPEGFEKTMSLVEFSDLLEYLSARGGFVPLDLTKVATVATDRGMFIDPDGPERILFDSWSPKSFQGIPFQLIPPRDGTVLNAIVLHCRLGQVSRSLPDNVSLVCNIPVKAIHILGGVAGWAYPLGKNNELVMTIRLKYADGQTEDHHLLNGIHIADYVQRIDVPKSQHAYSPGGKQVRYLAVMPGRRESLVSIELIKAEGDYAPVIMAVTVEPLGD